VRPRGTVVLKSTFAGSAALDLSPLVVDEIRLVGSRCGPFAAALRLLDAGVIETEPLLSAVFPFDQAVEAFEAARGALKVLIELNIKD
jgi:alcohol dehydrogenase